MPQKSKVVPVGTASTIKNISNKRHGIPIIPTVFNRTAIVLMHPAHTNSNKIIFHSADEKLNSRQDAYYSSHSDV